MSATAIAKPIAHGLTEFTIGKTDAGISCARPTSPEKLTDAERERLWAASKDDDDFTEKAIAFGKLTGDFTIDRHILPEPTHEELWECMKRIVAEKPGHYKTPEQVRDGT
jgi:hypothetical protein